MPRSKNGSATPKPATALSRRERRISTPNPDLAIIKVGGRGERATLEPREQASSILTRLAKALNKPGVDRDVIFGSPSGKRVYAYSIYPQDPTFVVREDAEGHKTVGRLVSGRFRAARKVD